MLCSQPLRVSLGVTASSPLQILRSSTRTGVDSPLRPPHLLHHAASTASESSLPYNATAGQG
eukprot:6728679-Lingulodinium_polyedra.AAC.1